MNIAMELRNAIKPNGKIAQQTQTVLIVLHAGIFLLIWIYSPLKILPSPLEVLLAIKKLWLAGLAEDIWSSAKLSFKAIVVSSAISLGLAYLSIVPAVRPLVVFISKLRFMSMAGLSLLFGLILVEYNLAGAGALKLSLLVFGISVFFVTSMADVVAAIPKERYDHARTLRLSPWQTLWQVVVRGRLHEAFDVLRQNAAIGWMMLTMVEGIARAEGGIGALLLNQNKSFFMAEVYGLQFVVLGLGLAQDWLLSCAKRFVCPYAFIGLER